MNIQTTLFVFLAYGLFAAMYNGTTADGVDTEDTFPTFEPPGIQFNTLPEDCDGFGDALFCIGVGIINFVIGIIYLILLIIEIIRILIVILTLIVTNAFTGFNGAPFWVNDLFLVAIFGSFAISIYKAIRKGDTDAT